MKKLLSLTILFIIPLLLAPMQGVAAPTWSGTTTYDFGGGNVTTMDWAVYKGAAAPVSFGSPTAPYTYAYTLNGWAGYSAGGSAVALDIFYPFIDPAISPKPTTFNGIASNIAGLAPTITSGPSAPGTATFQLGISGGTFVAADTATAWWTSDFAPVYTTSALTVGATTINSGTVVSQLTMAPGVPEPQTWALLITLMGFTTLWIRRRQDDDSLEIGIPA